MTAELRLYTANPTREGILLAIKPEPWMADALCREIGGEIFYAEKKGDTAGLNQARKACNLCPVKDACLRTALENNEEFGIWGGLSVRERRRLQRGVSPRTNRRPNGHGYNCKCAVCQRIRGAA